MVSRQEQSGARIEILVIEDNEDDFVLVREYLPDEFSLTWCATARRASEMLDNRSFDAILLDHGLPDSNALSFLETLRAEYPRCPVIVLTGREDRALAISARKKGAHNYLLKDEIADHLLPALRQAIGVVAGIRAHGTATSGPRFVDTAEQFYRVLLETMGEGCLVVDRDGIITFANPAVAAMFDCDSRHLLGRSAVELFTDLSADRLRQTLAEIGARQVSRPTPIEAELVPRPTEGQNPAVAVRISVRGVHRDDGAFECGLLILTDISEQVRARAMREDLIRTTVHDLRNPLGVIVGSLELVQGTAGDTLRGTAEEAIDVSLTCARKMLDLVGDLLTISRLESGQMPLALEEIAVTDLLERALRAQKPRADARGVHLDDATTGDHVASIDPSMIARVLQNLLDNALRFAPEGGRVAVRCTSWHPDAAREWENDAHICIEVFDDGPGISPDIAGRVFDKFVTNSRGGTGLGLAFCKLAVEAHGGRIWFDSEPDRGTTFYFTVPRRQPVAS